MFVDGPFVSPVAHVITPLSEIAAPGGDTSNVYVKASLGMSVSVAAFVTVSVANSAIVRLVCVGSSGTLFVSSTMTVNVLVALSVGATLSTTLVVKMLV